MIYTFHRKEGWYPIEFEDDEEAIRNVMCNPGTLKVVNEETEEIISPLPVTIH